MRKTPPPASPLPVDVDALISRLIELARDRRRGAWIRLMKAPEHKPFGRRIAGDLEMLADACRDKREWFPAVEFYAVAAMASGDSPDEALRIGEKARQMTLAIVDEKVSHPLRDEVVVDPLDWDHGWDLAESLALAGRFADADALIIRLQTVPDDHPYRGYELPGRFELIGDHVLAGHPELARWFYEMFHEAAGNLPADSAYEGYQRAGIVQTAALKIAEANARLPRRVATLRLALSAQGQGPRPLPEESVATVENGQVLKLVPSRILFVHQSGPDGEPEPIPAERLHRNYFRVRIEGEELRLFPEHDEYGRMRPFAIEPAPLTSADGRLTLFRLQAGIPVRLYYNVPGGGPAWTLTLMGIAVG